MGELGELLAKLLKELFEKSAPEIETFFRVVLIRGMEEFFRLHPELVRLSYYLCGGVLVVICAAEWMRHHNRVPRRDSLATPQKRLVRKSLYVSPPPPRPIVAVRPTDAPPTALSGLAQEPRSDTGAASSSPHEAGRWFSVSKHAVTIVCIGALLLAVLFEWPYAYYVLLRLGVCAVSLYWAVEAFKRNRVFWVWALGANAVLFNPVFPVRMGRSDWEVLNLLDAAFLATWMVWSIYKANGALHEPRQTSLDVSLPRYHRTVEMGISVTVVAVILFVIASWFFNK